MKQLFKFLAVACAIVSTASCTKETAQTPEGTNEIKLIPVTLTADLGSTKVSVSNEGKVLWQADDEIAAIVNGAKYTMVLIEGAGTKEAKFSGELPAGGAISAAYYPAAAYTSSMGLTVPEQTIGNGQTCDPNAVLMQADAPDNGKLAFRNIMSGLRLELYTETEALEIYNNKDLVTTVYIGSVSTPVDVFIPAGTYSDMLLIQTSTVGNTSGYKLASGIEFSRSKIKDITGVEFAECTVIEDVDGLQAYLESPSNDAYILEDIDLSGINLTACENLGTTLDGMGHSLTNWETDHAMIQLIEGGKLCNLTVDKSCAFKFDGSIEKEWYFAFLVDRNNGLVQNCVNYGSMTINNGGKFKFQCAPIVARQADDETSGVIRDCKNYGNIQVTATKSASCSSIAGVVGRIGHKTRGGQDLVVNCENEGNISFDFTGATKGMAKFGIGGVVGQTISVGTKSTTETNNNGTVRNCINRGNITWTYPEGGTGSYPALGGVAGIIEGEIYDCKNYGHISYIGGDKVAATDASIGGVAGYVTYNAADCHNYGEITVEGALAGGTQYAQSGGNSSNSAIGGVFGAAGPYKKPASLDENVISVSNCTNNVDLVLEPTMVASNNATFSLGGVVGYLSAKMYNCTNNNNITVRSNVRYHQFGGVVGTAKLTYVEGCRNYGNLELDGMGECPHPESNQSNFGGVIGTIVEAGNFLSDCHNYGKLLAKDIERVGAYSYLGGVLGGYASSGHMMSHCSNSGALECQADCAIVIGGLAGGMNGPVDNCKNEGDIICKVQTLTEGKEVEIGGLVGYINGDMDSNIVDCTITSSAPGSFIGGFVGGVTKSTLTWTANSTSISKCDVQSDDIKVGSVLGRHRANNSEDGTTNYSVTWKDGTIGGVLAEYPLLGAGEKTYVIVENTAAVGVAGADAGKNEYTQEF